MSEPEIYHSIGQCKEAVSKICKEMSIPPLQMSEVDHRDAVAAFEQDTWKITVDRDSLKEGRCNEHILWHEVTHYVLALIELGNSLNEEVCDLVADRKTGWERLNDYKKLK